MPRHDERPASRRHSTYISSKSALSERLRRMGTITDLPPELLEHIMKMRVHDSSGAATARSAEAVHRCSPFDYKLTHVCQRWRCIALACSALWSTIHLSKAPEWIELCLTRCPNGPLDLHIHVQALWIEPQLRQAIQMILPHLHRARSIDLHLGLDLLHLDHRGRQEIVFLIDVLEALTNTIASHTASILEEMDVNFPYQLVDAFIRSPNFPLTEEVRREQVARLRDISFTDHLARKATSLRASSLFHLVLYNVQCWHDIDGVIEFLQATPLLGRFVYHLPRIQDDGVPFNATRSHIYPLRCVRLDDLRYLELDTMFAVQVAIFSYVAIPLSTEVHTFGFYDTHDDEISNTHAAMLSEALVCHFTSRQLAVDACFDKVSLDIFSVYATISLPRTQANKGLPAHFEFSFSSDMRLAQISQIVHACLSLPLMHEADEIELGEGMHDRFPTLIDDIISSIPKHRLYLPWRHEP
ncbi:unnamed protein product [Peniophora sp. CBMAI 1063]|nr:unnamed protein product [Peniophora sp. CBMAI 1063]